MEAIDHEKEKARRVQSLIWILMGAFILVPLVLYYFFR
jgi:predicted nucleic acid-binding Zn ribbon protein